jgi:polyhydroxybutyrate depolymerase
MRRWTGLVGAVVMGAVLLTGCGDGRPPTAAPTPTTPVPARPGTYDLGFAWAGQQREFVLDAPPGYDPGAPTPLVVVLHGRPSTPYDVRASSDMDAFARRYTALVAYPAGYDQEWQYNPEHDRYDDVGFLQALVARLVRDWNADPDRVYAAGWSNGGSMVHRLAAQAPDVFAAVTSVSGPLRNDEAIVGPDAAPLLVFAGGRDAQFINSIRDGMATWRDRVGCRAGRARTVADGATRTECAGGRAVLYDLADMGHEWPPNGAFGVDVHEVMWDFYRSHARAG